MDASNRKSGRRRQPSKKYTVDAFEGLDIGDGITGDGPSLPIETPDDDEDDDFRVDPNASPEPPDDDLSIDGGAEEDEENQPYNDLVSDGESIVGSEIDAPTMVRGFQKSQELQRLFFFGPAKDDQMPALKSHYKWGAELTIPSHEANASGFGGFQTSYFHGDAAMKTESEEGWDWYHKGGKDSFAKHQQSISLSSQKARPYISPAALGTCKLLMGPYKRQSLLELDLHTSLDLNDSWAPKPTSADAPPPSQDTKSRRNGWMLNLGEKVQHLEWVPNIQGSRQFLAVTTSPLIGSTLEEQEFNAPYAPAFAPRPPTKSSIQIWEFRAAPDGRIDSACTPMLRKVICSEWGDVKLFKWCPMPRNFPTQHASGKSNLGLLAGIWADGALRVLEVFVEDPEVAETEYDLIRNAAFTAQPPNTICTCLTWLSSNSIIAGCANGCVGVWNIPTALQSRSMGDQRAPTAEPMTSKATMSPAATVRASRSRVGRSVLVWHEFAQVVLTVDDNFTLIAFPIRRFFRQISFTRYKSSVACLAYSPVHPFVMAGCVGGEAISNNPLRRAYENKVPIWNQTWFTHEWRQCKIEEPATVGASDGDEAVPTPQEISRILEGFKCKEIKLFNTEDAFTHRENGAVYSTVYDLKTTISSMAWNPNIHVGGWIAAGIANGLVRVEDVAS
ncbi:unnamed protein product [Aureobasidium pullulans]|nr:unnamed protein product [Aureobasidium pullulans]